MCVLQSLGHAGIVVRRRSRRAAFALAAYAAARFSLGAAGGTEVARPEQRRCAVEDRPGRIVVVMSEPEGAREEKKADSVLRGLGHH